MTYPEDFTAEDIMEFEYEWERYCDLADPYSLIAINSELQIIAQEQQDEQIKEINYGMV